MGASLGMAMAGTGLNLVGGYAKWREGRKMQRAAQNAINNFEWQDLQNPYDNLSPSTLGAELQAEEAARATASTLSSLQSAGTRALGVGAGRLLQNSNNMNRQIAADLDTQQKNIDFAKAGQDARNQEMIENRQANELQGYGQQLNIGNQMKYGGVADMSNAVMSGAQFASLAQLGMGAGKMGSFGAPPNPYPNVNPNMLVGGVMYGGGTAPTAAGYNDNAAYYAQNYGQRYA